MYKEDKVLFNKGDNKDENTMCMMAFFHLNILRFCKGYQIRPGITNLFRGNI